VVGGCEEKNQPEGGKRWRPGGGGATLGAGVPVLATSHCEIAGARNCLVVYVIFLREKKKSLFKILKVLPFLPQTLKNHFDVGYHPHFALSSK